MTTPTTVTFVGAKGGVGTSTIAALHAVHLARLGQRVRLSPTNPAGLDDLAALLGVPTPRPSETADVVLGLTLADHPTPDAQNIVDAGTNCSSDHQGSVYVVLRNDYLSLRRALSLPPSTAGVILVTEPNRALDRHDVADVLAQPIVAELRLDPVIARAVDAGLLATARHLRLDLSLSTRPAAAR